MSRFSSIPAELRKGTLNRPWFLVGSSALMSLGLAVLEMGEDFADLDGHPKHACAKLELHDFRICWVSALGP